MWVTEGRRTNQDEQDWVGQVLSSSFTSDAGISITSSTKDKAYIRPDFFFRKTNKKTHNTKHTNHPTTFPHHLHCVRMKGMAFPMHLLPNYDELTIENAEKISR